jgi:predicted Zn-dependent protease
VVVLWRIDKHANQANEMKNVVFQGLIIVVLFFGTWFLLRQVDWMTIFGIERITTKMEEKLGDTFWDIFKSTEKENKNEFALQTIDSVVNRICIRNKIERDKIKIHLLEKDEVNAFAIPNNHLIIYTGLLKECESAEELAGVLGHEIAHMQMNHVMKKLIKETGLTLLISISGGKTNGEVVRQAAKVLSSTAFDRRLEKEADMKSVDYLVTAQIDPEPFGDFMYRLSTKEPDGIKYLSWVNTHPDSKERSEYIIKYGKSKSKIKTVIVEKETWQRVREIEY